MSKPEPVPDQATRFYWEGAKRGELLVQRCDECHSFQFPPTVVCESCHSKSLTPAAVSGRGTVYSKTVLHQAFLPVFADDVPFTVALIDLEGAPGARVLTNIIGDGAADLAAGAPVEVFFEERGDSVLPQFRPAGAQS
jgi:uncharacterized OB-fold protein